MALVLRFCKIWGVLRYLKIVKNDLQLAVVVGEGRAALNKAIEGHIPLLSMAHRMAYVLGELGSRDICLLPKCVGSCEDLVGEEVLSLSQLIESSSKWSECERMAPTPLLIKVIGFRGEHDQAYARTTDIILGAAITNYF